MNKPIIMLTILLLTFSLSLIPAASALTVSTNKSTYNFEEQVIVKGKAIANTYVTIKIRSPVGNVVYVAQPKADEYGNYAATFTVGSHLPAGNYTVEVYCAGITETTNFTVKPTTPAEEPEQEEPQQPQQTQQPQNQTTTPTAPSAVLGPVTGEYILSYTTYAPVKLKINFISTNDITVRVRPMGGGLYSFTVEPKSVTVNLKQPDIYRVEVLIRYDSPVNQTMSWAVFGGNQTITPSGADEFPVNAKEIKLTYRIIAQIPPSYPSKEAIASTVIELLREELNLMEERYGETVSQMRRDLTNVAVFAALSFVAVIGTIFYISRLKTAETFTYLFVPRKTEPVELKRKTNLSFLILLFSGLTFFILAYLIQLEALQFLPSTVSLPVLNIPFPSFQIFFIVALIMFVSALTVKILGWRRNRKNAASTKSN